MRSPSGRSGESEERLVERARRGDVEAYGESVARYQDLARRAAFVILRDADAAKDAAQDAFAKAFTGPPQLRGTRATLKQGSPRESAWPEPPRSKKSRRANAAERPL